MYCAAISLTLEVKYKEIYRLSLLIFLSENVIFLAVMLNIACLMNNMQHAQLGSNFRNKCTYLPEYRFP